MTVVRQQMMQNFSRAAEHYDAHAHFQHGETARVLDAALMLLPTQARILDLGCGTGYFAARAAQARPEWEMLGLDLAPGMCRAASKWMPAMQADAVALPLADSSVDAVVSSLCLQWVEQLDRAFAEIARVLRPGGRAIIASLGAESLTELRHAAMQAELPLQLLPMAPADAYHQAIAGSGLHITLFKQDPQTEYFVDVAALLGSMRMIGANAPAKPRGLASASRWRAMRAAYETHRTAQGLPATWDRLFMLMSKPS